MLYRSSKPNYDVDRINSTAMVSILSPTLGKFNHTDHTVTMADKFRVEAVYPDRVVYSKKDDTGKVIKHEIPSNFVLWSTGIAMNPFTRRVADLLPNQVHRKASSEVYSVKCYQSNISSLKAIEVDPHLRVVGAPLGTVYALGDCATVCLNLSLSR